MMTGGLLAPGIYGTPDAESDRLGPGYRAFHPKYGLVLIQGELDGEYVNVKTIQGGLTTILPKSELTPVAISRGKGSRVRSTL
jgi:hypothetical protein